MTRWSHSFAAVGVSSLLALTPSATPNPRTPATPSPFELECGRGTPGGAWCRRCALAGPGKTSSRKSDGDERRSIPGGARFDPARLDQHRPRCRPTRGYMRSYRAERLRIARQRSVPEPEHAPCLGATIRSSRNVGLHGCSHRDHRRRSGRGPAGNNPLVTRGA